MRNAKHWNAAMGLAAIFIVAAGCGPQTSPTTQPASAISPDDYAKVKVSYLTANPNARVGRVAAILTAQKRFSVEDINVADFRKGDVVSVVDKDFNVLADGTVADMDADYLYVDYAPATSASRPPGVGDMVIRAESPKDAQ